jgi:hypothetical protein
MTHPNHTRQQLTDLKFSDLKTLAAEMGAVPSDKRSKDSFIAAILTHQPQLTEEPAELLEIDHQLQPTEEPIETIEIDNQLQPTEEACIVAILDDQLQLTEEPGELLQIDYPLECQKLTNTRAPHELVEWCIARGVSQGREFSDLYANILNNLLGFVTAYESVSNEWGCVDQYIHETAELSEAICKELQINVVDLSTLSDDLVIPHGVDAYHAYCDNNLIASIHTWGKGYVSSKSKLGGCSDPYSAILETIEPAEVERARNIVLRVREIKEMDLSLTEKSILIEFRQFSWVKSTIADLSIQKLIDRGLLVGYDTLFGLTDDGSKYLEMLLLPDYV